MFLLILMDFVPNATMRNSVVNPSIWKCLCYFFHTRVQVAKSRSFEDSTSLRVFEPLGNISIRKHGEKGCDFEVPMFLKKKQPSNFEWKLHMKGLWMMVACLYLDIFTLDSLSTPFVFWRTSQTGSGRRRDFGHANLWPAAMAGEHAKLGVRLNKTFDSRCFQFAAGISTRNEIVYFLGLSSKSITNTQVTCTRGEKSCLYYCDLQIESIDLHLIWYIPLWNHLGGYRCVQNHFPKMMRTRILGEFDGGGAG